MRDYGMSLESIERNYGCVAEYNRCMEEREYERGYEPTYEELVADGEYEEMHTNQFCIGDEIRDYEFDGGITDYKIIKFNKDRTKVFVTEHWLNIDGNGKRKPHWCNLIEDEISEKFQPDDRYDSWIRKER